MSIVVLGSINSDLVLSVKHLPAAGQTVRADDVATYPGGKGANQATAVARLGYRVRLIGRVGDDAAGRLLLAALTDEGVDVAGVGVDEHAATGTALITVEAGGANTIVTSGGANHRVGGPELAVLARAMTDASMLLVQLEIPMDVVVAAAGLASHQGVPVMLDPAPVTTLPDDLYRLLSWITPNEHEAAALGLPLPVENVVVTLGERGCRYAGPAGELEVPAPRLPPVDTVACGDAFNGALAVAMTEGRDVEAALWFACAAGAVAATKPGAAPSLPRREEVEDAIDRGDL